MTDFTFLATTSLRASHAQYLELVKQGVASEDVSTNQFGEMAMKIDIACEKSIIDILESSGLSIQVISEEHGDFTIGQQPEYTAFIDGLDGSSVFKDSGGKARCGTMFSMYKGLNPAFGDYLFGGIADHILGQAVLVEKSLGVNLIELNSDKSAAVSSSEATNLDQNSRIYIDEGVANYQDFPGTDRGYFYDPIKTNFETKYLGSSAVYGFDFAKGDADLVLEYGRKNNLEHMVDYPLVIESGGVFQLVEGEPLETMLYQDYCKLNSGYPAIIMAATKDLAQDVRKIVLTS